jgi:hypothetical protein
MTSNIVSARQYASWQFSLKSLMFVTMIVAVCAALVNISAVLAIFLIPLIVVGLLRTVRVVTRAETRGIREAVPGLFATFCRSIVIIIATIGVGVATVSFAGVAAALIAVMLVIHVLRAAGVLSHPLLIRAGKGLIKLAKCSWTTVTRINPVAILRWLQAHAVAGTLSLYAVGRRLFRQWWSVESQIQRTEPL